MLAGTSCFGRPRMWASEWARPSPRFPPEAACRPLGRGTSCTRRTSASLQSVVERPSNMFSVSSWRTTGSVTHDQFSVRKDGEHITEPFVSFTRWSSSVSSSSPAFPSAPGPACACVPRFFAIASARMGCRNASTTRMCSADRSRTSSWRCHGQPTRLRIVITCCAPANAAAKRSATPRPGWPPSTDVTSPPGAMGSLYA